MYHDINIVFSVIPPWLCIFEGSMDNLISCITADLQKKTHIRKLDAGNMKVQERFYDELSNVLELPDYFRNLNALDECITDLDGLPIADGFCLVIENSELLLNESSDSILEGFLHVLSDAGEEWSQPVVQGEEWDRTGIPFHVIFQVNSVSRSLLDTRLRRWSLQIGEIKW